MDTFPQGIPVLLENPLSIQTHPLWNFYSLETIHQNNGGDYNLPLSVHFSMHMTGCWWQTPGIISVWNIQMILSLLGVCMNSKKLILTPATNIQLIGILIDSQVGRAFLPLQWTSGIIALDYQIKTQPEPFVFQTQHILGLMAETFAELCI